MKEIEISNKVLGKEKPTFIVAEIGANQNNNVEDIKKIVKVAKECGVDAVKFQTYTSEELLADKERVITWGKKGKEKTQTIADMFDEIKFDRDKHREVFEYAKSLGLIVFSTPFSVDGVRFLNSLNVPCFKVASSDVNYVDMLIEIAKTNKPVILSLGKCSLSEADKAISLLQENGCENLILMHCVAQYPSPMNEMNLKIIESLKIMYPECIIGFSDHSVGITAAIGAVALGARVIEKHFTLDKNLEGPDHWFSMNPIEMKEMVTEIRNLEMAMGSSRKRVLPCEKKEKEVSTRSLVINKDIKNGEQVRKEDLDMLRPGWGISPFDKDKVVGLKVTKDLNKGTVLTWDCFK
ncbi:N-acetylneuraminate synthase family protein [uncultured Clostridium sp.]|uniref:N-acetylneuraminate synthase family protein n=1 Tax=uncultured Clostridium sp. TaxID=59620 RepID=UPI0025D6D947|nr:N-acetylneuraminate synthase family protein [uncultured Clostridium sp.]